MKTIRSMEKSAVHILGRQLYDPDMIYKDIPFLARLSVSDGVILFNILTREMIFATEQEWESRQVDADRRRRLVEHWFLLPEHLDPETMAYQFRAAHRARYGKADKLEQATILPTTACNAQCLYCYEDGCEKRSMAVDTARDVAEWIRKKANPDRLTLKWFGGEPLLNPDAIETICRQLRAAGMDYDSVMVTNGLLLDQHDAETLTSVWRLKRAQITLDGTRSAYHAVKRYTVPGDAYGRVIGNIGYLLALGIRVDIRLNLSMDNYMDLACLVDDLKACFGHYGDLLLVYSHPLFECDSFQPTEQERKTLYGNYIKLQEQIAAAGIGAGQGIPRIRSAQCMADNGTSVVILPGGELGLCEHHLDDEYIGSIYSDKRNQDIIRSWRVQASPVPECGTCTWRPACLRLKKCPGKAACDPDQRWYLEYRITSAMMKAYEKFKEDKENYVSDRRGSAEHADVHRQ